MIDRQNLFSEDERFFIGLTCNDLFKNLMGVVSNARSKEAHEAKFEKFKEIFKDLNKDKRDCILKNLFTVCEEFLHTPRKKSTHNLLYNSLITGKLDVYNFLIKNGADPATLKDDPEFLTYPFFYDFIFFAGNNISLNNLPITFSFDKLSDSTRKLLYYAASFERKETFVDLLGHSILVSLRLPYREISLSKTHFQPWAVEFASCYDIHQYSTVITPVFLKSVAKFVNQHIDRVDTMYRSIKKVFIKDVADDIISFYLEDLKLDHSAFENYLKDQKELTSVGSVEPLSVVRVKSSNVISNRICDSISNSVARSC